MMKLVINGIEKGNVIHYEQDRDNKRWTFLMDGGETTSISFDGIKRFTSTGELNIITRHWNSGMIENLTEREAQDMAIETVTIKGHTVYFVDFGEYFGYSALVFMNGMHIYYANDYELHHHYCKTREELRKAYIDGLSGKLFTEEEIAGPVADYDEYERKCYFLHNYYGMRKPYVSIFGNPDDKQAMAEFTEKRKTFTHYDAIAFAYYEDESFVRHHVDLYVKLERAYLKKSNDFDYWVDAFKREMYNHEYAINYQADYDTLSAFGSLEFYDDGTPEDYFDQLEFTDVQRRAYAEALRRYQAEVIV